MLAQIGRHTSKEDPAEETRPPLGPARAGMRRVPPRGVGGTDRGGDDREQGRRAVKRRREDDEPAGTRRGGHTDRSQEDKSGERCYRCEGSSEVRRCRGCGGIPVCEDCYEEHRESHHCHGGQGVRPAQGEVAKAQPSGSRIEVGCVRRSIGTDRSAADERGGAEQLALQPKAKPYVRRGSAKAVQASGIEWRPQIKWPPGVAWWHGTSLDGRPQQEMFGAAQARVGPNRSVGPPAFMISGAPRADRTWVVGKGKVPEAVGCLESGGSSEARVEGGVTRIPRKMMARRKEKGEIRAALTQWWPTQQRRTRPWSR